MKEDLFKVLINSLNLDNIQELKISYSYDHNFNDTFYITFESATSKNKIIKFLLKNGKEVRITNNDSYREETINVIGEQGVKLYDALIKLEKDKENADDNLRAIKMENSLRKILGCELEKLRGALSMIE